MKKLAFLLLAAVQMIAFSPVSAHSHHHHEDRFNVPDWGDTLTATVDVLTGIFTAPSGSTITPYISTPDGYVEIGTATLISSLPAVLTFPTVDPVVEGAYTYGLLVNGTGISVSSQTLPVIIHSTATDISTTTNIFIPAVTLTTTEAQFNASFVYHAAELP